VEQNAALHRGGVVLPVAAFHEVTDEIAEQRVFVAEREETVGEVIHVVRK
jgi:hypothetical protein